MNLADYLGNLLEETTEVSVPGLGYFVREHISAAYSEAEGRFYPPAHRVKFIADQKSDDLLTEYIARQKNISLASSKYFAEKFVNKLYDDVAGGRQLFSNLGAFQLINNQLVFEPNKELPNDPDFYGLPAAEIVKLPVKDEITPVTPTTPRPSVATSVPETIAQIPATAYPAERPKLKKSSAVGVILLAALLVLIVAAFAIYKLNPAFVNTLFSGPVRPVTHKKLLPPPPEVRRDTVRVTTAGIPPGADTSLQNAALSTVKPDTVPVTHYEVIVARFPKKQVKQAAAALKQFQSKGVDAKIAQNTVGLLIKITAGTFDKQESADSLMSLLIKEKKIKKSKQTYILQVNPKK